MTKFLAKPWDWIKLVFGVLEDEEMLKEESKVVELEGVWIFFSNFSVCFLICSQFLL